MPAKQRQYSGAGRGRVPPPLGTALHFGLRGHPQVVGWPCCFKANPMLSSVSSAAVDPHGRFVAAQCDLCGSNVTLASVYAPVERQERTPFFLQRLMPALPTGTPLVLGGDWNCVAGDQDLVGGQPGTRQHKLSASAACCLCSRLWACIDAFRHLHPDAHEFTHTATSGSSSAVD